MVRRLRRWLIVALVVALAATLMWRATRPHPIVVQLETAQRGLVESTVANTRAGTVHACNRARLAPSIGGRIARLPVHEGDAVEAGQLLLELWNDDLAADNEVAQRDVEAARAQADQACVSAQLAQRETERVHRLREQNLASEEQADRAAAQAEAGAAACRAAKKVIGVREARVASTAAALERTVLRAPFAGTIAEINGEIGEFITPSPVGIPTPPAVDIVDRSCLYIKAPIDEVDAPAIRAGMPARITLDAFPGRTFAGEVRRVAPYVLDLEKQARTVEIEAAITDEAALPALLPGYSADVEVIVDAREDVLRIPTQCVLEGDKVLVYDEATSKLREQTVETGLSNWEYTEVVSGIGSTDRVVVSVDREGAVDGALATPES